MARKASTTGPRSASSQTLRISGPRTVHAGRAPSGPLSGRVAMLASASEPLPASGIANGGSRVPASSPREPTLSVRSVLSVM